jgi:hypothetical protein
MSSARLVTGRDQRHACYEALVGGGGGGGGEAHDRKCPRIIRWKGRRQLAAERSPGLHRESLGHARNRTRGGARFPLSRNSSFVTSAHTRPPYYPPKCGCGPRSCVHVCPVPTGASSPTVIRAPAEARATTNPFFFFLFFSWLFSLPVHTLAHPHTYTASVLSLTSDARAHTTNAQDHVIAHAALTLLTISSTWFPPRPCLFVMQGL